MNEKQQSYVTEKEPPEDEKSNELESLREKKHRIDDKPRSELPELESKNALPTTDTKDQPSAIDVTNSSNVTSTRTGNDTFVERYCELQGAEWYPTGDNAWQLRAPYFLLPGAKKSGTTSLASYITQHPSVIPARTKELQFFLNKNFRGNYVTASRKTAVQSARQHMYALDYHHKALEENKKSISFDGTPGYLFFSTMLPQRILCVCPWVKLLVVLRNPVDRAYSNWAYAVRRVNLKMSFERWIEEDFEFMKQAGLVHDWNKVNFNKFAGSPQEDEAWTEYLRLAHEGPIGRGMYEMQLRHWFQAMKEVGRDPKKEILVIRSEDLKKNVDKEYEKVLKFLNLPDHQLTDKKDKVVSNYTMAMNATTRQMLEDFYAPYNRRLYKFLGGGDWKGYWDPAPRQKAQS